jgi:hypothetical protein
LASFQNRGHYGNAIYIDNINIYDKPTVSIQQTNFISWLSVYPNPASESIRIDALLKENTSFLDIALINSIGQLVYRKRAENAGKNYSLQIDVNGFSEGIYLLSVSNGKEMHAQRVLIK